ncbi:MAG: hypothetical protein HY321_01570 [Armatimonadetes bacterium]|nr:hypothetical protein [Armatimonadota bacterium]
MRSLREETGILLAAFVVGLLPIGATSATAEERPTLSYTEAVELARAYMAEEEGARRAEILRQVEGWSERLDEIALALRPVPPANAPTGHLAADRFTVPRIRARMRRLEPRLLGPLPEGGRLEVKDGTLIALDADSKVLWRRDHPHPEGPIPQLIHEDAGVRATAFHFRVSGPPGMPVKIPDGRTLYYAPAPAEEYLNWAHVPEDYDPGKPLGMVIHLHGGGGTDTVNHGAGLARSDGPLGELLRGGGHIAVCSGTPRIPIGKWTNPESEIHIESIIEEYSTRYAIDPDRVYLAGGSMGGYGSWHHIFRHADRFALIAPMAAGVPTGYWPKLQGTLLYLATGVFDPRGIVGLHVLERMKRLENLDLTIINAEYPGGHPRDATAGPQLEALHELINRTRRNPYLRRACAVSPYIMERSSGPAAYKGTLEENSRRYPPQPYSFWVSVLETGPGGIVIEDIARSGDPPALKPVRRLMRAGAVDAENLGGNRFRVKTTNVRRFALWLHPKMGVNFAKPIEIEVIETRVDPETLAESERGRRNVTARATPSLAAMLKYLGDRRDYGLIYHAAVEVTVGESGG